MTKSILCRKYMQNKFGNQTDTKFLRRRVGCGGVLFNRGFYLILRNVKTHNAKLRNLWEIPGKVILR